jgi:DNA-binding NarL/FixJ family response regulator
VLTTSEANEDVRRSYDLHANAFVTKPIDFEHFAEAVGRINEFYGEIATLPQAEASPST